MVDWRETARADLLKIVDHISDDSPKAAQRLKDNIEQKVSKLVAFPLRYRKGRVPGTREMVVSPNYVVVYTSSADTITVLRVLHAAQQWPQLADTTAK